MIMQINVNIDFSNRKIKAKKAAFTSPSFVSKLSE